MTPPDAIATPAPKSACPPALRRAPRTATAFAPAPRSALELVEVPVDLHACRSRNG